MWATDHEYTCTVPKSQETKEPGSQKDQETRGPDILGPSYKAYLLSLKELKNTLYCNILSQVPRSQT